MSNKDVASALVSQDWDDNTDRENTDDDDASNEWTPSNFPDNEEEEEEFLDKPAAKVPRLGNYNRWVVVVHR